MCMEKPGRARFRDALLSWGVPHPCAHVLVPGSRAPQGCFACVNHSSGAEESGGSSGASRRVLIAAPLRCFQNPFVPLTRITIHFYLPTPHWDALKVPLLFPPPHTHTAPILVPTVSAGLLENCTGCVLCSEENGCITCHHRLFLLIWRDGIRQYGVCVHTCPPGYFGVRGLEVNRCTSTWCSQQSCSACGHPGVPPLPGASPGRLVLGTGWR